MDKTYRFVADVICTMQNGETHRLRDYRVVVDAGTSREAYDRLEEVATEQVHDEGSRLLDCPLDHLVVLFCRTE